MSAAPYIPQGISLSETADDIRTFEYVLFAAYTFLVYDHIITFGDEMTYFWRRPVRQGAFWFFLNRYVAFFGNTFALGLEFSNFPESTRLIDCNKFGFFRQVLLIFQLLIVAAFLGMQTYALYNRSRRILVFLLFSGISLVSVALILTYAWPATALWEPRIRGCYTGTPQEVANRYAAAFEANFLFDTLVFFLTMYRTWTGKAALSTSRKRLTLVALVFRNGALYYGAMALVNFANIMTIYFARPFLKGSVGNFASGMCVTLMSRLMLSLQRSMDVHYHEIQPNSQTHVIQFTTQIQSYEPEIVQPSWR